MGRSLIKGLWWALCALLLISSVVAVYPNPEIEATRYVSRLWPKDDATPSDSRADFIYEWPADEAGAQRTAAGIDKQRIALVGTESGLYSLLPNDEIRQLTGGKVKFVHPLPSKRVLVGTTGSGLWVVGKADKELERILPEIAGDEAVVTAVADLETVGRFLLAITSDSGSARVYEICERSTQSGVVSYGACAASTVSESEPQPASSLSPIIVLSRTQIQGLAALSNDRLLVGTNASLLLFQRGAVVVEIASKPLAVSEFILIKGDGQQVVAIGVMTFDKEMHPGGFFVVDPSGDIQTLRPLPEDCRGRGDVDDCAVSLSFKEGRSLLLGSRTSLRSFSIDELIVGKERVSAELLWGRPFSSPAKQVARVEEYSSLGGVASSSTILLGGQRGLNLIRLETVSPGLQKLQSTEMVFADWSVRSLGAVGKDHSVLIGAETGLYRMYLDCKVGFRMRGLALGQGRQALLLRPLKVTDVVPKGRCPQAATEDVERGALVSFKRPSEKFSERQSRETAVFRSESDGYAFEAEIQVSQPSLVWTTKRLEVFQIPWLGAFWVKLAGGSVAVIALIAAILLAWREGGLAGVYEYLFVKSGFYRLASEAQAAKVARRSLAESLNRIPQNSLPSKERLDIEQMFARQAEEVERLETSDLGSGVDYVRVELWKRGKLSLLADCSAPKGRLEVSLSGSAALSNLDYVKKAFRAVPVVLVIQDSGGECENSGLRPLDGLFGSCESVIWVSRRRLAPGAAETAPPSSHVPPAQTPPPAPPGSGSP